MKTNIRFIKSVSKANPLPIVALNMEGKVKLIYSNGLAESLFGYDSRELVKLSKDNFKAILRLKAWRDNT